MNKPLSMQEYLDKYYKDPSHAIEVKRLSLQLFDGICEKLKPLSDKKRKMLEAAALLHDIGYNVASKGHNKHSYNLIIENGLENFTDGEIKIIANVSRYHRGKNPDKKKHAPYAELNKKDRKTVKRLSGILRIADGLDRGHMNLIRDLSCDYNETENIFTIKLTQNVKDFRPEIIYAVMKKDLFEKAFKTQAVIKFR